MSPRPFCAGGKPPLTKPQRLPAEALAEPAGAPTAAPLQHVQPANQVKTVGT